MVAFRKYQCYNVGTLLPTLGSIGLGEVGEVGEVVTGPERSGHGQQPHQALGSGREMSRTRLWRPWRHSGAGSDHHLVLALPSIYSI